MKWKSSLGDKASRCIWHSAYILATLVYCTFLVYLLGKIGSFPLGRCVDNNIALHLPRDPAIVLFFSFSNFTAVSHRLPHEILPVSHNFTPRPLVHRRRSAKSPPNRPLIRPDPALKHMVICRYGGKSSKYCQSGVDNSCENGNADSNVDTCMHVLIIREN